MIRTIC